MMALWHVLIQYLFIGAAAGFLSGLLGIGGGLFVVPALAYTFQEIGIPDADVMHIAVGTSFLIMVITASRSLLAHLRYALPFWSIFKKLLPGVLLGTLLGAQLAHWLHSDTLRLIFAVFVLLVAVELFFFPHWRWGKTAPPTPVFWGVGGFIGLKSGMLGLGGGAITIPFLTTSHVPMRQAVLVSTAVTLTVALLGALFFALVGDASRNLSWSIGSIYLPAVLGVSIGSVLMAPVGSVVSHWLPVNTLKKIFALFLVAVATHMLMTR